MKNVPRTHIMESFIRFRWPHRNLSINMARSHISQSSEFRDLDLDCRKNLPSCITQPIPTYQVSSIPDEKSVDGRTDGHRVWFCKVISVRKWPRKQVWIENYKHTQETEPWNLMENRIWKSNPEAGTVVWNKKQPSIFGDPKLQLRSHFFTWKSLKFRNEI